MLLDCPESHLHSGDQEEYVGSDYLSHYGECQPAECLPEIVGAAYKVETPPFGDPTLCGARLSQVAKSDVAHQVHELKHSKDTCEGQGQCGRDPLGACVVGVQEEVHVDESENEPVVAAVLEKIEEGHSIIAESVHEQGLQLSLKVVTDDHRDTDFLVESKRIGFAVNLFLQKTQYCSDKNGTKVFDQEYSLPRYLRAEVLEHHSDDLLGGTVIANSFPFISESRAPAIPNSESDSLNSDLSLSDGLAIFYEHLLEGLNCVLCGDGEIPKGLIVPVNKLDGFRHI
jgi:hypothetical protein